jgi:hypothetical protein
MPKRVQLKRQKGFMLPPNSRKVDRSTKWGNPFKVGQSANGFSTNLPERINSNYEAVEAFKYWLKRQLIINPNCLEELRNKNLACWCKLDECCHADVLLEAANANTELECFYALKNIYD